MLLLQLMQLLQLLQVCRRPLITNLSDRLYTLLGCGGTRLRLLLHVDAATFVATGSCCTCTAVLNQRCSLAAARGRDHCLLDNLLRPGERELHGQLSLDAEVLKAERLALRAPHIQIALLALTLALARARTL